jgi:hypothetical protein
MLAARPSRRSTLDAVATLGRGVNLAPIRIEYAHRDGARWPIKLGHKRDDARDASCVGAPFPEDVGRTVEELDSVLHRSPGGPLLASSAGRHLTFCPRRTWGVIRNPRTSGLRPPTSLQASSIQRNSCPALPSSSMPARICDTERQFGRDPRSGPLHCAKRSRG